MAERPGDQNAFSIRGLDGPMYRLRTVAKQHPPGSDNLGFTQIDPRAPFRDRVMQSFVVAQEQENPLGTIVAHNQPRVSRAVKALRMSWSQARRLIGQQTGDTTEAVLAGVLPTLGQMALWTGGGAVLGAGVGALGGPADEVTIPGGAIAGFDAGLWLGGVWALKNLLTGVGKNLSKFTQLASDAVELAWYAGDDPRVPEISDLNEAAEFFAYAIAELWMVILEALVLAVMHKAGTLIGKAVGSPATHAALGDVSERLSKSKLGEGFGKWFENNFDKIEKSVEEWRKERTQENGDGPGEDDGTGTQEPKPSAG